MMIVRRYLRSVGIDIVAWAVAVLQRNRTLPIRILNRIERKTNARG